MPLFRKDGDESIWKNFIGFFNKLIFKQIFLAILFTTLLFFVVIDSIAPDKVSVKLGDMAPYTIRATKDIVDEISTERLREEAMNRVEPRHRVDPSVQVKIKNDIKKLFELTRDLKDYDGHIDKKLSILQQQSTIPLSEVDFGVLIKLDDKILNTLESNIYDIINQIMPIGIKSEEIEYEKENVIKIFDSFTDLDEDVKSLGVSIVNISLKPNRFLDIETTQQKKKEAAEMIEPVIIKEGQIIVEEKGLIDERILSLIKKSGLLKENDGFDYRVMTGTLLIILLLELVIIAYLYVFDKEVLENIKLLVIISIIIISTVSISKGINSISSYLLPISAATMLIAILINPKLSILINSVLAITIGMISGNDAIVIIMLIVGGSVGAFGVINTHQRHNIFITGLIVSIANMLIIFAFGLVNGTELNVTLGKSLYGILNGIFSAILTIGSLPLWESVFGIVTPLKLLELSNPNHPLLKKLLLEAPGTYHHSIVVGNLSESAADAIKANSLLARVGAYYHDVGKLKRPYFFKENQLNGENPHDKINPNLSTLIITNHTKDGVDLAKKYKLPQMICDIIKQHHGVTIVAYFYHKAMQGENSDLIKPDSFRYEGPKPQTKEAAIVMLADSVEAAVRAMNDPTKGKIEGLVRQIIKNKLNDGQLDECDLTLKDLDIIANSFLNILLGIFHERIEYPKFDLLELQGGN